MKSSTNTQELSETIPRHIWLEFAPLNERDGQRDQSQDAIVRCRSIEMFASTKTLWFNCLLDREGNFDTRLLCN